MGLNNRLVLDYKILKEGMHKWIACFIQKDKHKTKSFDQSNTHGKWAECLCDPLNGNKSIIEHLHQSLMSKCANQNRLVTLHLEYVNCSIFLTTYMQRISKKKLESVQMLDWTINVSTKAILTWTSTYSAFITIEIIDAYAMLQSVSQFYCFTMCWVFGHGGVVGFVSRDKMEEAL